VNTTKECKSSFSSTSKPVHTSTTTKIHGNSPSCKSQSTQSLSLKNSKPPPFLRYEKRKRPGTDISTYHFIGYSSLYGFYHFPEKTRLRLSQFVILSPYQRQGHGCKYLFFVEHPKKNEKRTTYAQYSPFLAQLYKAIYQYVLSKPNIAELTVEDPAEAFEDLRDKNDMEMLQHHEQFTNEAYGTSSSSSGGGGGGRVGGIGRAGKSGRGGASRTKGKLGPPADKSWIEKWRKDLKIAGVRFLLLS